jgi:hypothetical protein
MAPIDGPFPIPNRFTECLSLNDGVGGLDPQDAPSQSSFQFGSVLNFLERLGTSVSLFGIPRLFARTSDDHSPRCVVLADDSVVEGISLAKGTEVWFEGERLSFIKSPAEVEIRGTAVPKNALILMQRSGAVSWYLRRPGSGHGEAYFRGVITSDGRLSVFEGSNIEGSAASLLRGTQTIQGLQFKDGSIVDFHPSFYVASGKLEGVQFIDGLPFENEIEFYDDGRVKSGWLAHPTVINGVSHPPGFIFFDPSGRVVPEI